VFVGIVRTFVTLVVDMLMTIWNWLGQL